MYKLLCDLKDQFFLSQTNSAGEREFLTPTQFMRKFVRFRREQNDADAVFSDVSGRTIRSYYSEYVQKPFAAAGDAQTNCVSLCIKLEPQLHDVIKDKCDKSNISVHDYVRHLLCVSIEGRTHPALTTRKSDDDMLFECFSWEVKLCPDVHARNMSLAEFALAIEAFSEKENDSSDGCSFSPLSHSEVRRYFGMYQALMQNSETQ